MGGDIVEFEKIIHSLKGISCILATMSEVKQNGMQWNEWALQLLNNELIECIKNLEELEEGE